MERTRRWFEAYGDLMAARAKMAKAAAELWRLRAEREALDG